MNLKRLWFPVVFGIAIIAVGVALRAYTIEQDGYHLFLLDRSEAGRLRNELTLKLNQRRDAMTAFAEHWAGKHPTEAQWRASADSLLESRLEIRAVEWREPNLSVRWYAPIGARLAEAVLDPRDDALRQSALNTVEELPSTAVPASFPLHDGSRQLLISAPMNVHDGRMGYMVGVVRVRDLMDVVLREGIERGFQIAAYEGPFLLFGPQWDMSGDEGMYVHDALVNWSGLPITFKVWPSKDSYDQVRSRSTQLMIPVAVFFALVFGVTIYRMDTWRARALAAGWAPEESDAPEQSNATAGRSTEDEERDRAAASGDPDGREAGV